MRKYVNLKRLKAIKYDSEVGFALNATISTFEKQNYKTFLEVLFLLYFTKLGYCRLFVVVSECN